MRTVLRNIAEVLHVRPSLPRARAPLSVPFCGDCPDRDGCSQNVPCELARESAGLPSTEAFHAAVSAELVRLTLGQRGPDRPELAHHVYVSPEGERGVRVAGIEPAPTTL